MEEIVYDNNNFLDTIKRRFEREEVIIQPNYERSVLDKKIEHFLDEKFEEYIDEFGIVTEEKLTNYDRSVSSFEKRVDALGDFIRNADRDVIDLEKRVQKLQATRKK